MADGAPITLRRHGNPSGPRRVFSHGNALAADLYYPFWSLLMDRFDIVLYDVRSHGWNPVWGRQTHNFPRSSATAKASHVVSDSQSIDGRSTPTLEQNRGLACPRVSNRA